MKKYRLTPQNLDDMNWAASVPCGVFETFAESEKQARRIASDNFFIASPRAKDGRIAANPWSPNSKVLQHLVLIEQI